MQNLMKSVLDTAAACIGAVRRELCRFARGRLQLRQLHFVGFPRTPLRYIWAKAFHGAPDDRDRLGLSHLCRCRP
jgi:hypothetical protein